LCAFSFSFTVPSTPSIYTLSLHDALPISALKTGGRRFEELCDKYGKDTVLNSIEHLLDHGEKMTLKALKELPKGTYEAVDYIDRSEEHTSELQSRFDLVCRLLLEKKKKKK